MYEIKQQWYMGQMTKPPVGLAPIRAQLDVKQSHQQHSMSKQCLEHHTLLQVSVVHNNYGRHL